VALKVLHLLVVLAVAVGTLEVLNPVRQVIRQAHLQAKVTVVAIIKHRHHILLVVEEAQQHLVHLDQADNLALAVLERHLLFQEHL
jgi:hypothetical protein